MLDYKARFQLLDFGIPDSLCASVRIERFNIGLSIRTGSRPWRTRTQGPIANEPGEILVGGADEDISAPSSRQTTGPPTLSSVLLSA